MKLIVQIPCYNEEHTLPATVRDIPRSIPGIDVVEILIIDDGSKDRTIEVAHALGVDHILINKRNLGLARTFKRGLDACLARGADIIVNTDGDNQYYGPDIALLVQPIVEGRADVVIGDRQTGSIDHFSSGKKFLQTFGSSVVRRFSGVEVPDAVSGFRAISREAALRVNIVTGFSYTIEMLIQVGRKGMAFTSVPVRTNDKTRDSRLFSSVGKFIERSGTTLLRMYTMYSPLKVFTLIGLFVAVIGVIPITIFLIEYFSTGGAGRVQSLVIGTSLLTIGTLSFVLGLLADLINFNRQLIETTLEKVRRMEGLLAAQASQPQPAVPLLKAGEP